MMHVWEAGPSLWADKETSVCVSSPRPLFSAQHCSWTAFSNPSRSRKFSAGNPFMTSSVYELLAPKCTGAQQLFWPVFMQATGALSPPALLFVLYLTILPGLSPWLTNSSHLMALSHLSEGLPQNSHPSFPSNLLFLNPLLCLLLTSIVYVSTYIHGVAMWSIPVSNNPEPCQTHGTA